MSNSKETSTVGGIGFFGALAIVFITLKLLEKIDWSWWWVLSPLWLPLAVAVSLLALLFVIGEVGVWWDSRKRKR